MEERRIDVERKILEELETDMRRGKGGHYGALPVEVLINTFRVTLQVSREEIERAIENLYENQFISRSVSGESEKEVISITEKGLVQLKKL